MSILRPGPAAGCGRRGSCAGRRRRQEAKQSSGPCQPHPGPPLPAQGPAPPFTVPWGLQPLPAWRRSSAGLQFPTAMPCPAVGPMSGLSLSPSLGRCLMPRTGAVPVSPQCLLPAGVVGQTLAASPNSSQQDTISSIQLPADRQATKASGRHFS